MHFSKVIFRTALRKLNHEPLTFPGHEYYMPINPINALNMKTNT